MTATLIGTHLDGGQWSGYPCKKVNVAPSVPPILPTPLWYAVLCYPVSAILGLFWFVVLSYDRYLRVSRSKVDTAPTMAVPTEFCGSFTFQTGTCTFEKSGWKSAVRCLYMARGTYVESRDWNPWWNWASYYWSFDSNLLVGRGRVQLGWWSIPLSILSASLERDGEDWVWSHRWFSGQPIQVGKMEKQDMV
uniref:Uncharacterized protein n=2 Tax=Cyclophora tenuis TaxID=216820 RepID=A0A7S1D106_CYCTE|mmetsp:Transcript_16791/g.28483  ORF Transcript_16791/g.28483 Transcript_16791/m.28483 type:complete len:192 (+) Transcript_16791:588-1163(+)